MEIIVFEKESYYKMLAEVKRTIFEAVMDVRLDAPRQEQKEEWVTAKEAQRILRCKKDKLKSIRDKDEIKISQNGRTLLYSSTSLYDYLGRNIKH